MRRNTRLAEVHYLELRPVRRKDGVPLRVIVTLGIRLGVFHVLLVLSHLG